MSRDEETSLRHNCLILPVLSGSMMPYLRPGGQVRIECDGADRARPGDIIVFHESDMLVAHRLLFRLNLGRHSWLYQRGDSAGIGSWVKNKQVIGIVTQSMDSNDTLLYVHRNHDHDSCWSVFPLIIRAVSARARSVLNALAAVGSTKR